jgi:hypothetical protein
MGILKGKFGVTLGRKKACVLHIFLFI